MVGHKHLQENGTKLCTIINGHKNNDNMGKDVTPFPDQEQICHNVSQGKYQSQTDMLNMYEQICVEPPDVEKMVFVTTYGTFTSNTMQQGNCNTPVTF